MKSADVLVRCPVSPVTILIKDRAAEKIHRQALARMRSFRNRQAAAKGAPKAKPRPKAKARISKKPWTGEPVHENWPVFLPHLMLQSVFAAGLIKSLSPSQSEWFF